MTNTTNKNLQRPANNTFNNTWDQPLNSDFSYIDTAFGGFIEYSATTGSQTLTNGISDTYSYIPLFIKVKNSMSANVTYTIPAGVGGTWIVYNTTTDSSGGPFTVTFASGGGGASAVATRNTIITIVCDGTNVYTSSSAVSNVYNRTNFTATAAQTTFTVSYTPSRLDVYVNGVLLDPTDYTASNGTTVVLGVACSAGDLVSIMTY
jgi:hypothetical protein